MDRFVTFAAALCVAFLVNACGGSAGGGTVGELGAIAQRGTVAVMLASESSDEVLGLYVTYTKISLVPEDGSAPVTIYEDTLGKEVNLSELDDEVALFAVADDVPTGSYSKLLVTVASVRVVGGPCEDLETSVKGDELELVPDEPIDLAAGDTVVLRLSMDTDKSILIDLDGATDTCTVRPVIAVDIATVASLNACPTVVEGTVSQLVLNAQFENVAMVLDLGGTQGEQDVIFDGETAFFDSDGYPADSAILAIDDDVAAKGELDDDGALVARVVVEGATAVISGTVLRDAHDGEFVFLPDAGQAVVGRTVVRYFDGTQILLDCAKATDEVIVEGSAVAVTGKIAVDDGSVRAVSIFVSPTDLVGELIEMSTTTGGWQIAVIPEGTQTIRIVGVPTKVGFFLEGDGPIPAAMLADLVECEGRPVRVTLDKEAKNDVATEVRIGSENFKESVEDVIAEKGLLLLEDVLVAVRRDATILDLRGGQKLISLDDIEPGDVVRAFGLVACPDEDVDFHGFVLLVLPEEDRPKPPVTGDEGCHYNHWKKNLDRWPARYGPDTLFADVFDDVFPGKTLYEVIDTKGGELNHLGRETVAALLSAASEEIDFALTVDEVVRAFNAIDHSDEKGEVKDLQKEFHQLTKGECVFGGK